MQAFKYKEIEYSSVNISELWAELRVDSDYYDAEYIINEKKIQSKDHCSIDNLLEIKQYWLSLAMNEDGIWYKILKMDNIIGILASDSDSKYVDIDHTQFESFTLQKWDVLFNRVNSEEYVWRTWIYLLEGEHTFASYLIKIRAKEYYTNFYISIFLNSRHGRTSLNRVKRRSVNQANINAVELWNLNIPLPSDDFQIIIEQLVTQSYQEKDTSVRLYKEAENILLQELNLLEFKPMERRQSFRPQELTLEGNFSIINSSNLLGIDRFDAEYRDHKYLEIEQRILEYHLWYDTIINNIATISKEKIKLKEDKIYNYIELADISKATWLVESTTEIMWKYLPSRARMKIQQWDILFSSLEGSIDKVAIIDFEKDNLVASTGFYIFREWLLNKETLLVLLKFLWEKYIAREALGTIMSAISSIGLERVILPKVDSNIQSQIAKKIQESFIAIRKSKDLLELAKKSVEIFIEENEENGLKYIKQHMI